MSLQLNYKDKCWVLPMKIKLNRINYLLATWRPLRL